MVANNTPQHLPDSVKITLETQNLVEQTVPNASDAVKQKTMELIEIIKQQVQTSMPDAADT
ncbi:MAG: hypothetical protein ACFBSF_18600 [Leptolyngbyaceae cyanobacterium]